MEALVHTVATAFADVPRPEHFTNYEHCGECSEYDALFRSRTVETLSPEDMGPSGLWDPVCLLSEQGFFYYLPALARFACGRGERYCLNNLLGALTPDRIAAMSLLQRETTRRFLSELGSFLADEADFSGDREDLAACIQRLAV